MHINGYKCKVTSWGRSKIAPDVPIEHVRLWGNTNKGKQLKEIGEFAAIEEAEKEMRKISENGYEYMSFDLKVYCSNGSNYIDFYKLIKEA